MPTVLLNKSAVKQLLDMREVTEVVEQALRDTAEGRGIMPPKAYLIVEKGEFRAMPAALPGAAGVKWVNVHPQNPSRNLPTVMAVIIYSDPETGYPLAIMDATDITAYRTGATAAIASNYLAKKASKTLGIVGAGRQAVTQIAAHAELFSLELIKVYDISPAATARLIQQFPDYNFKSCSLPEAIASDIVCTLTPSRVPFVKDAWVKAGTHINAVGADAEGKEELEPAILKRAKVVVDDLRQASMAGEINVPVEKKIYRVDEVYGTLGDIITGKKKGRTTKDEITIFDSTGVGIEDVAVAKLLYEKAQRGDDYPSIELV